MNELDKNAPTLPELRSKTADFLRENRQEFLPYLTHPDTGGMLSESQYDEYCDQVANTIAWGGEIEVSELLIVKPFFLVFNFPIFCSFELYLTFWSDLLKLFKLKDLQ